ncbi:hypothetical protein [uncultured Rhodoblastus sp.]|uniref:hypothetical protein n=1 Tax=uncultured Rhodoblastus sp. TaxID=543037 RepID=UPI0025ECA371|nr:hypothetical protein [uncultured Rhodoblastus sp.]
MQEIANKCDKALFRGLHPLSERMAGPAEGSISRNGAPIASCELRHHEGPGLFESARGAQRQISLAEDFQPPSPVSREYFSCNCSRVSLR